MPSPPKVAVELTWSEPALMVPITCREPEAALIPPVPWKLIGPVVRLPKPPMMNWPVPAIRPLKTSVLELGTRIVRLVVIAGGGCAGDIHETGSGEGANARDDVVGDDQACIGCEIEVHGVQLDAGAKVIEPPAIETGTGFNSGVVGNEMLDVSTTS